MVKINNSWIVSLSYNRNTKVLTMVVAGKGRYSPSGNSRCDNGTSVPLVATIVAGKARYSPPHNDNGTDDRTYFIHHISRRKFDNWRKAESKGKFYNLHIRDRYKIY